MHAHNIPGKFIGTMRLLAALRCFVVQARADTDTLPFFIGKCGRMLTPEPLVFIHHGSPIISWFVGRVELTARDGVNRINGKQSRAKSLATSSIPCCVHRLGYLLCGLALHP